jgi:DNA helicase-2/ATP-dependent DNA helicase PcrA
MLSTYVVRVRMKTRVAVALRISVLLKFALEQYESVQDFLDYIDQMTSKAKHSIDGVQLMTIHKSKGLEFKVVYVVGCSQGLLPHFKAIEASTNGKPLAIEEERRLLYVAITRAEGECFISSSGSFNGKPAPASMFVKELGLATPLLMKVLPGSKEELDMIEEDYDPFYDEIAIEIRARQEGL